MTSDELKATLATIERGYEEVHTGATMDRMSWDSFDEGREAYAALLQHIEQMEAALKPFAAMCEAWLEGKHPYPYAPDDLVVYGFNSTELTIADYKQAAAALAGGDNGEATG